MDTPDVNVLTIQPLDVISTVGIWVIVQSAICIICCCAPTYRPLFPERRWSHITSKIRACCPRLKSKQKEASSGSQAGSLELQSLDPYFQGEGRYYTPEGYNDSARCLIISDARPGASCNDKNHLVGSVQVDRRVDVGYAMCQTFERQRNDSSDKFSPLIPSPAYLRALKAPPDVSYAGNIVRPA